jgi:exo-1,4-beta-D-glucosaminidase
MLKKGLFIGIIFYSLLFFGCNKNDSLVSNNFETTVSVSLIQSQNKVKETGEKISLLDYDANDWVKISLPNTILAGLVEAGIYTDIYKDKNLDTINSEQFNQPWWYRFDFNIEKKQFHKLIFEGINYRANVWLNGKLIADTSEMEGAFGIWSYNIIDYVKIGKNIVAVQVFPPKRGDLTIGFVDWNPPAPDKNTGIWRPVKITSTDAVSIEEPYVKTNLNTKTLDVADLNISVDVTNNTKEDKKAEIFGKIGDISFSKTLNLKPEKKQTVVFTPQEFKQLTVKNPKLWWPNLMGDPNLYKLSMRVMVDDIVSDAKDIRFGIRKIETYWTKDKHKGYKVNGKKVLIKGAGWVDDLLLADTDEKVENQLKYVKHMNLNTVRLEGFWGRNQTIYNKADELGLLIMIGWSCHWEWEDYCGRPETNFMCITSPRDMELQARAYQSQVKWLRNHPSIFTWVFGSDKLPLPELEKKLNDYINEVDGTRPLLASCKYEDYGTIFDKNGNVIEGYVNNSEITGPTGVKMLGPYAYTTPSYWYINKNAGGAYGFNTETGPGAQVPPLESIEKMISKENLWPINDVWDYHSGRNEFSTLSRYLKAFNARYGEANSVEDFAFRSQISNYEAIRAMFEAFEVNKFKATGVIQWMLNSAWTEMFWQLYDWYLMPNGAFYGTKKACQPVNAIYNYGNNKIYLTNNTLQKYNNLTIEAVVYDIQSKVRFSSKQNLSIDENKSVETIQIPKLNKISTTYFLYLKVSDNSGNEIANNFYWLSTKPDVHNWEETTWVGTPYKSYADFTQLNTMNKAEVKYNFTQKADNNGDVTVTCNIKNNSENIAFFIELSVKDKETHQTILPVFWSDNYISLIPGERKTVSAKLPEKYVKAKELEFEVKGLNIK